MENKPINELNEVYDYLSSDDELYHHGVLGMKWGIRRYQPYSLIPRGSGKRGKEVGAAKTSKSTGSSSGSSKRTKKKSRKQTQEEIKAQKIKNLQTARQRSEEKQKILKSGDAKLIYENRDSFTRAQIDEAMNRIDTEKKLRALVAEQNPSKSTKLKKSLTKVVNSENLQKAADVIEKGANLYNQTARVANVFRDDEHQLKYVGKAENKKVEKKLSKELQDILNSGDAQKILDNQSKFTDDQIKSAKQRQDNLRNLEKQAAKTKEDSDNRAAKYRSEAFDAVDTYGEKYAREKLARDYGSDNANKLVDSVLTEKKLSELDSQAAARYISKTKYDAVEEERRRKGQYRNGPSSSVVKHSDISVDELTGVYDYLSSDDELYHHGVLGMKWGIRRYQSYDTVPRGSGKGGKEVGAAKGESSERINVKKKYPNKGNQEIYNRWNNKIENDYSGKESKSVRKKLKAAIDNNDYDAAFMDHWLLKDDHEWPDNMAILAPGAPALNEPCLKEYEKYCLNPKEYLSDNKNISEKTGPQSIEYKGQDENGYHKADVSFGTTKNVTLFVADESCKKIANQIVNDKKLDEVLREHVVKESYDWWDGTGYNVKDPSKPWDREEVHEKGRNAIREETGEDRNTYKKNLECESIQINNRDSDPGWWGDSSDDTWITYSNPKDLSNRWIVTYDSKNKKITGSQRWG